MEALEIDHDRKEPFLRLPDRLSNIILTPPRSTDSDAIVTLLNDPRVYMTLEGPPYPYEHRFAVEWLERVKSKTDLAWTAIRHSSGNEMFGASPVRILREVNDDGSQTFLGDCGIERWGYPDVENLEERERLVTGNLNRPDGDVGIIWTIGDYLAPSHHGQGIMTAAVRSLMGWAIPHMGVHEIRTTVHEGNMGSVRVFEKNGFAKERMLAGYRTRAESKGGGSVGLQILTWHRAP